MILFKQQVKLKIRSKQNTYHVTNENIALSEVTDNVGDEGLVTPYSPHIDISPKT